MSMKMGVFLLFGRTKRPDLHRTARQRFSPLSVGSSVGRIWSPLDTRRPLRQFAIGPPHSRQARLPHGTASDAELLVSTLPTVTRQSDQWMDLNSPPLTDPSRFEIHQFATAGRAPDSSRFLVRKAHMRGKAIGSQAMAKPPNKRPGEVSVRGLQRLIGLKYERDPKRGTRGKPGGFLLIWPAMGLDARFSAPWFHTVYTAHAASSPDWLRAQRPCLENPNMVTHGLRLARLETVQDRHRERSGIPLARGTWDRLLTWARQLGVAASKAIENGV